MTDLYETYKLLCYWWFAVPLFGFGIFVVFYIVIELINQIKYKNRYVAPETMRSALICDYQGPSPKKYSYVDNFDRDAVIPFLNTLDQSHTDTTEQMIEILYPEYSHEPNFLKRYLSKDIEAIYIYKLNDLGYYFSYIAPVRRKHARYHRKTELIFELQFAENTENGIPYIPNFVCQRNTSERKAALYFGDYRFKKQPYRDHMWLIQKTHTPESTKLLDQLFENSAIIEPLHNLTEMGAIVSIKNASVHILYSFQKDYDNIVEYANLLKEALPHPEKGCPDYIKYVEEQNKPSNFFKGFDAIIIPPIRNALILGGIALLCYFLFEADPAKDHIEIPELFLPAILLAFFTLDSKSFTAKIRAMWGLLFWIVPLTAACLTIILKHLPW